MLSKMLMVAIGSGAGGALRYAISLLSRTYPSRFPYWTLAVNVIGGFLIGILAATMGPESDRSKLLLMAGFCGGFTTFSAFSLETLEFLQQGAVGWALLNVALNTICAITACWIGFTVGK